LDKTMTLRRNPRRGVIAFWPVPIVIGAEQVVVAL